MQGVSFKGWYQIPLNNNQNPTQANYRDCMTKTVALRNPESKATWDNDCKYYFVDIKDDKEKLFESYCKQYGINFTKASPNANAPQAEKEMAFLAQMERMGCKSETFYANGVMKTILYDDTAKNIFGVYEVDGKNLVKKTGYLDGKPSFITEYRENGNIKTTTFLDENGKPTLKFAHDKNGNYEKIL